MAKSAMTYHVIARKTLDTEETVVAERDNFKSAQKLAQKLSGRRGEFYGARVASATVRIGLTLTEYDARVITKALDASDAPDAHSWSQRIRNLCGNTGWRLGGYEDEGDEE